MRFLITAGCLCFISFAAAAQQKFGSLQEVLQYADRNNTSIRQAQLQPQTAQQDVHIQTSGLYPKINVYATGDYYPIITTQVIPAEALGGPKGTYQKVQFGLPYVFAAGAELSMPVINLEKWAQLQKSRHQYEQSQWNSKAAIENLHIQTIQAYYQVLATEAVLALNRENITIADELMRIMQQRMDNGVLNPADFNRSKNLQLDVQSSDVSYKKSLQQSRNNLNTLLNIPVNNPVLLADSLMGFDWPLPVQQADVHNRPGMMEASAKLLVAEFSLSESKRGGLPKLSLNGRYAYNFQSRFESGYQDVNFDVSSVGLRLDVPLFQGNYYRAGQKKNAVLLQSAKLEQERVQHALEQQQADWINQYRSAFERKNILQQKLEVAAENLRIARLNMNEGVMEFDEFNNIFSEYNRARMDYLQNLADGILYHLLSTQNF
jgi:outer membrane protein TolC